jgi:hypothetical protein
MPYNIKNETKKKTEWMEKCVSSVMSGDSDKTKSQAIAICKAQLTKSGEDSEAELSLREELWDKEARIYHAIGGYDGLYLSDIFDEYVILEYDGLLYKVYYTDSGDEVSINWDNVSRVEKRVVYDPVITSSMRAKSVFHGISR